MAQDREKETLILFDNIETDSEKLARQIALIKNRINEQYSDNLLEGILAEIASLQIAYQHLILRAKSINSQLRMLDFPIQHLIGSSQQVGAREVTIDATFNLTVDQGFYEIERSESGSPFRWTGPKNIFHFDLLIDRTETRELILKLASALKDENIDQLRCLIDDQEVFLNKDKERGFFYLKGIVPKRMAVGWTRIAFIVPKPVKISEINPESQDSRALGVAFVALKIQPLETEITEIFEIN
jgi:hypothetical protein